MVSPWMEHGTIMEFIRSCPDTNLPKLVNVFPEIRSKYQFKPIFTVGGCCSWAEIPSRLAIRARRLEKCRFGSPSVSVQANHAKSNILIDGNKSARIADFGLTSVLRHHSISISMTAPAWGGTIRWMAPELYDEKSSPSKESDIYALGMVVYEVGSVEPSDEPVLKDHSCRFSLTTDHSLISDVSLCLIWCYLESGPRGHRTGRFLVSRMNSGH